MKKSVFILCSLIISLSSSSYAMKKYVEKGDKIENFKSMVDKKIEERINEITKLEDLKGVSDGTLHKCLWDNNRYVKTMIEYFLNDKSNDNAEEKMKNIEKQQFYYLMKEFKETFLKSCVCCCIGTIFGYYLK